jgi:hypothetical protein
MAHDRHEEFWEHVRRHLQERFHYSETGAREAEEQHRQGLGQHDALEAVYHWMPAEVAQNIDGGGYRESVERADRPGRRGH